MKLVLLTVFAFFALVPQFAHTKTVTHTYESNESFYIEGKPYLFGHELVTVEPDRVLTPEIETFQQQQCSDGAGGGCVHYDVIRASLIAKDYFYFRFTLKDAVTGAVVAEQTKGPFSAPRRFEAYFTRRYVAGTSVDLDNPAFKFPIIVIGNPGLSGPTGGDTIPFTPILNGKMISMDIASSLFFPVFSVEKVDKDRVKLSLDVDRTNAVGAQGDLKNLDVEIRIFEGEKVKSVQFLTEKYLGQTSSN
jgi:hypothetical protein